MGIVIIISMVSVCFMHFGFWFSEMPTITESCSEQVLMIYHHHHHHQSGAASVESSAAAVAFFSCPFGAFPKKERKKEMGFVHNPWNTDFKSSTPRVILCCTTDEIQTRQIAWKTKQNDWEFAALGARQAKLVASSSSSSAGASADDFVPVSFCPLHCGGFFFLGLPDQPRVKKTIYGREFIEEIIRIFFFFFNFLYTKIVQF